MGRVLKVKFGSGEEGLRAGPLLRFGDSIIDLAAREIAVGPRRTRIEPRAAAVLSTLIEESGQVVSREALLDGCWPPGEGSDEALTQAIAQLRRALGDDPKAPAYIATVPKAGYRWIASVAGIAVATARPVGFWRPARIAAAAGVAGLVVLAAGAALGRLAAPQPHRVLETEEVFVTHGPGTGKALPPLPSLPSRPRTETATPRSR